MDRFYVESPRNNSIKDYSEIFYELPLKSVPGSQKTHWVYIIKRAWSILFRKITAVYSENHTKRVSILCGQIQKASMLKRVVHVVTTVL
jgi:hypothetical protein